MNDLYSTIALIIVAISAVTVAGFYVWNFFQKPSAEIWSQVKAWMLLAVTFAEKELGSGTGKLKLRYVYDMFLDRFGTIAKYITFEQFSKLVDEALEEMRKLIESNKNIQEYIGIEDKTEN